MCRRRHTFRKPNDAAGVPAITSEEKTVEKITATMFVNGDEFAVQENRVIRVRCAWLAAIIFYFFSLHNHRPLCRGSCAFLKTQLKRG